jgi:heterodisulfide reductase subunit C
MATSDILLLKGEQKGIVALIEDASGVNVRSCYQCGKCTGGCPAAFAMDLTPRQVVRHLQLGDLDSVLKSQAIWLCVSCRTCAVRCPRGIDLSKVMDALRILAQQRNVANIAEKDTRLFHHTFLNIIRRQGRLYELGLVLQFNLKSKHLLKDAKQGIGLFRKGKISILPSKIHGAADVHRIYARTAKQEDASGGK